VALSAFLPNKEEVYFMT